MLDTSKAVWRYFKYNTASAKRKQMEEWDKEILDNISRRFPPPRYPTPPSSWPIHTRHVRDNKSSV
jgi:hypothetical protein